jgi:glutathione S-transferase
MDPDARASFLSLSPLGKMPVLRDETRRRTIPETTIIIDYLEQFYPGRHRLIPQDGEQAIDARLWDRFFDLYIHVPMQKIVIDNFRPAGENDRHGVAEAHANILTAYGALEKHLADKVWAIGERFSIADCAAAPALFYAGITSPFDGAYPNISAYFDRLVERPSVKRVIEEARPYFPMFPLNDKIPGRFL